MSVMYEVVEDCFQSRLNEWVAPGGAVPSQEQLDIARLMFCEGDRHFTKEDLAAEVVMRDLPIDETEIDSTLRKLAEAGWVRKLVVDSEEEVFDTNLSDHHHFFDLDTGHVTDIPDGALTFGEFPDAPEGMEIVNVDVVVTMRRKRC